MGNDATCLKLAKRMAEKSEADHRHGCVVLKKGKPIATGFNKYSLTPFAISKGYFTTHAEIDAFAKLRHREDIGPVDILVVRINNKGELLLSKPCQHCMRVLKEMYNINKIMYSESDGSITMMRL